MRKNPLLAKLRAGKVSVMPCISFGSPETIEHIAHVGFDSLWLDGQHSTFTESSMAESLARFAAVPCAPIVRVNNHDWGVICSTLDAGAMGIIVPMVQTVEQAKAAVQATKNPPLGGYGLGWWRARGASRSTWSTRTRRFSWR